MSQRTPERSPPSTDTDDSERPPAPESQSVDGRRVLDLLSDDDTRRLLATLTAEPLPARRLAEKLDVSRATVYRRLNRLETAGLVESRLTYHEDGHHRKRFRPSFDHVELQLTDDGVVLLNVV